MGWSMTLYIASIRCPPGSLSVPAAPQVTTERDAFVGCVVMSFFLLCVVCLKRTGRHGRLPYKRVCQTRSDLPSVNTRWFWRRPHGDFIEETRSDMLYCGRLST